MEVRDLITSGYSKKHTDAAVHFIGNDKKRFDKLMSYCFTDDLALCRQACRVASDITSKHPELIEKYIPKLVEQVVLPQVDQAVKRHTLKILQKSLIPVESQGILMDFSFKVVESFEESPAVKANALTVLYNLSKTYPGILGELVFVINDKIKNESPAFKSRATKILDASEKT